MSRIFRFLGFALVGVVALLALALALVYWITCARLRKSYAVISQTVVLPADSAALARGQHIALVRGCTDCHGADFGGAKVIESPLLGTIHGPNLTRGRGGVVAGFTDENWARAIRHGLGPDGRPLFLMPSEEMSHFSDDDLGALIAYIKSLPPVDRAGVPVRVGPLGRVLMVAGVVKVAAEEIDHAHVTPDTTPPGVTVAYGRYLATGCAGCHGARFTGGRIPGAPPDYPPAQNLTPHPSADLAKWTEQDFITTLRTAHRPDGSELSPVMPRAMGQMSDEELKALWLFLRTLEPLPTGSS
jgi:cytochrome c553